MYSAILLLIQDFGEHSGEQSSQEDKKIDESSRKSAVNITKKKAEFEAAWMRYNLDLSATHVFYI